MNSNTHKKSGQIMLVALSMVAGLILLIQLAVHVVTLHSRSRNVLLSQEQAKLLALSGVTVALTQLACYSRGENKEQNTLTVGGGLASVTTVEEAKTPPSPAAWLKAFYLNLLPKLNRWQEVQLDAATDGLQAELRYYISSQEGKLNLKELLMVDKNKVSDGGVQKDPKTDFKQVSAINDKAELAVDNKAGDAAAGKAPDSSSGLKLTPAWQKVFKQLKLPFAAADADAVWASCPALDSLLDPSQLRWPTALKIWYLGAEKKAEASVSDTAVDGKPTTANLEEINLYDLFTVYNQEGINPLLLSASLQRAVGLEPFPVPFSEAHKKLLEKITNNFDPANPRDWSDIKALKDFWKGSELTAEEQSDQTKGKPGDPDKPGEVVKQGFDLLQEFLSPQVEPRLFSVLSCAKINGIEQRVMVIVLKASLVDIFKAEGAKPEKDPTAPQKDLPKPIEENKKPVAPWLHHVFAPNDFEILRVYWL